jgi:hypothetical protein
MTLWLSSGPEGVLEIGGWITLRPAGHDCEAEYLAQKLLQSPCRLVRSPPLDLPENIEQLG